MTDFLIEARNHLVSPERLREVAALLDIPGLDEAETNSGAPRHRQQATLYAKIADWAGVSARASEQLGTQDFSQITTQYAYLIEAVEEHLTSWWAAPGEEPTAGVEKSADTAETFALAVLDRYLRYLAEHLDDFDMWLDSDLHLRVSVWDARAVAVSSRHAPRLDDYPPDMYGRVLKQTKVAPHAVEIRTPRQVRRHVDNHRA